MGTRHDSRRPVGTTTLDLPVGYHPARAEWLRRARDHRIRYSGDGRFLLYPPHVITVPFPTRRYVNGVHAAVLRTFLRWGLITECGAITPAGRLVLASWDAEEGDADLSGCPFFRDSTKTCVSGCWTEPACVADQPEGGWPRAAVQPTYG